MEPWHTYILWSETRKLFYFGATSNLQNRLQFHNNGYEKFTRTGIPWVLAWSCVKNSKSEALALEKKLKNLKSQKRVREFILKYSSTEAC